MQIIESYISATLFLALLDDYHLK